MQPDNCLNCGEALNSTIKFCPNCGQKTELHRLSLHEIGHDAVHYFTHADKGIFTLIKDLALKPGKVAREFVTGRRKKHFPPLNFILIVAGICLLMTALIYPYSVKRNQRQPSGYSKQMTTVQYDPIKVKRGADVGKFFAKYSNLVTIAAIPLLSFFCWLFYFKGRYNYTEHIVANMYLAGFTLLPYAFIVKPLDLVVPRDKGFLVIGLYFLFEIVYRAISYYYFMNQKTKASAVKSVFLSLALVCLWITLVSTVIYLYRENGFWGLIA